MSLCPCRLLDENKPSYEECCGRFLETQKKPSTAEELMRARYTAYVKEKIPFVAKTQIAVSGDEFDQDEALKWARSSDWLGLKIIQTQKGKEGDKTGIVEFQAFYKDKATQKELAHHETSLFDYQDQWLFKEGHIHAGQPMKRLSPKLGRNDPCGCGSGKKFKKCCGA